MIMAERTDSLSRSISVGLSARLITLAMAGMAIAQNVAPGQPRLQSESRKPASWTGDAQPTYAPHPARLPEAGPFPNPASVGHLVQYALANNPEIQAARCHARALSSRIPQAASLSDPNLLTTAFLEDIQTAAGPQQLAMSLSQKFPWFGKRSLRSEVANYDAVAAYARVMAAELQVTEEVKKTYYDLYFVDRAIEETRKIEQLLKDIVEVAERRYQTGVGQTGLEDVLQVRNELSKLRISLIQLEQSRRRIQARLLASLHVRRIISIETERGIDRVGLSQRAEVLVSMVEGWQPELEARRHELARDHTAIEVAQREYWPDVTVALNWFEMGSQGLSPVANGRDAFSMGVGVNLPIYRGRLDAAVREAQCQAAATAQRYATTQDRFRAEVYSLHAQLSEHDQVLEILQREIVPRSIEAFELVTTAYRTGRAEFQQLLDTYRTLLQYRIDLHRRESLREQAFASLERAVGGAITSVE